MTEQQSKIEWQNSRIAEQQSFDFRRSAGSINGKIRQMKKLLRLRKKNQDWGLGIDGEYIFIQMNTRRKEGMNKYASNTRRKIDTYSVHIKCIFSHWKADRLWAGERSENRTCRKKAGGKRMSVSDGQTEDGK